MAGARAPAVFFGAAFGAAFGSRPGPRWLRPRVRRSSSQLQTGQSCQGDPPRTTYPRVTVMHDRTAALLVTCGCDHDSLLTSHSVAGTALLPAGNHFALQG